MSFFTANDFEVVSMFMRFDPWTGRNPNYAFVDMKSEEDAQKAIDKLCGLEILPGMNKHAWISLAVRKQGHEGTFLREGRNANYRWRETNWIQEGECRFETIDFPKFLYEKVDDTIPCGHKKS